MHPIVRFLAPGLAVALAVPASARAEDELRSTGVDFEAGSSPLDDRGTAVDFRASASPLRDRGTQVQFDGRSAWDDLRGVRPQGRARVRTRLEAPRATLVRTELPTGTLLDGAALRAVGLAPVEGSGLGLQWSTPADAPPTAFRGSVLLFDFSATAPAEAFERVTGLIAARSSRVAASVRTLAGAPALRLESRLQGGSHQTTYVVAGTDRQVQLAIISVAPIDPAYEAAIAAAVRVPKAVVGAAPPPSPATVHAWARVEFRKRLPYLDLTSLVDLKLAEANVLSDEYAALWIGKSPGAVRAYEPSKEVPEAVFVAVALGSPGTTNAELRAVMAKLKAQPKAALHSDWKLTEFRGRPAVVYRDRIFEDLVVPLSDSFALTIRLRGPVLLREQARQRVYAAVVLPAWLSGPEPLSDARVTEIVGATGSDPDAAPTFSGLASSGPAPSGDAMSRYMTGGTLEAGLKGTGVYAYAYTGQPLAPIGPLLGLELGGFSNNTGGGVALAVVSHVRLCLPFDADAALAGRPTGFWEVTFGPQLAFGVTNDGGLAALGFGGRLNIGVPMPFGGYGIIGFFGQNYGSSGPQPGGTGLTLGYQLGMPGGD